MKYGIIFCLSFLVFATLVATEHQQHETDQDAEHELFVEFMKKYGKKYNNPHEYSYRLKVFKQNLKRAEQLQKTQQGSATYGVTKFSDLTGDEFKRKLGLTKNFLSNKNRLLSNKKRLSKEEIPKVNLPKNYDWRDHNAVTEVKNQGSCGSCWTFSVTGNVEGQYAIKYGNLTSLSEQEIVDCDKTNAGCSGGWPPAALQSLDDLGGLTTESNYPYTGVDGTCTFDKSTSVVKINASVLLPVDEDAIAQYMYSNGPISICLNANDMQLYSGGISHPSASSCEKYYLNHAVLITGFGVKKINKKKTPYWIIKNSWGTDWGEEGYYRVYRGDGTCGLDLVATSALIQ